MWQNGNICYKTYERKKVARNMMRAILSKVS